MISVIIPAYNASQYISRAVASILLDGESQEQSNAEFEVIIVENGSTDNTTEVTQKLCEKYENVHLYHSDKGVSNARNLGLDKANGDYIIFVDADDYLTEEGRKELINIRKDIDLCVFGHEAGEIPHSVVDAKESEKTNLYTDMEKCRAMMISNPTRYMQAWAKLFNKRIIDEHSLRFDSSMSLSEDTDFTLRYTKYCNTIYLSDVIEYHYSIDNNSTMRGNANGDKVPKIIHAMETTYKAVEDESDKIRHAFYKYILMNLNISMVRDVYSVGSSMNKYKRISILKQTAKQKLFREAIKAMKIRECLSPRMIPVLAMKMHIYCAAGLVYSIRAKQNYKRENKK